MGPGVFLGVIWSPGHVEGSHKDLGFITLVRKPLSTCMFWEVGNPGGQGVSTKVLVSGEAVGSEAEVG